MKKWMKKLGLVLTFTIGLNCMNVFGATTKKEVVELPALTIDDATQFAIENSSDLVNLDQNNDINEKSRNDAASNLTASVPDAGDVLVTSSTNLSNLSKIVQLDIQLASYQSDVKTQKTSIQYSIKRLFGGIISAENDLKLFDESLAIAKKQLEISQLKNKLGLISNSAFNTEKVNYDKKVKERAEKATAIDKSYVSLNNIIGKDANQKYKLSYDPEYKKMNVEVQTLVGLALAENPTVLKNKGNIQSAEFNVNAYSYTGGTESYDTKSAKLDQAYRDYSDSQKSISEKVRNAYTDIMNAESQYDRNIMELSKLEGDLPIKQKQLALGKITELDLRNYQYSISTLKNTIQSQKFDHELKVMQIKNSFLL